MLHWWHENNVLCEHTENSPIKHLGSVFWITGYSNFPEEKLWFLVTTDFRLLHKSHEKGFFSSLPFHHVYSMHYLTDQILSNKNPIVKSNILCFVNTAHAWTLSSWTINSTYLDKVNTPIASKSCLEEKSVILAVLSSTFKFLYLERLGENPKQRIVICHTEVYLQHVILSFLIYPVTVSLHKSTQLSLLAYLFYLLCFSEFKILY